MELPEVGYGGMDWIQLAQDRESWRALVSCGNELTDSLKCGEFLAQLRTG